LGFFSVKLKSYLGEKDMLLIDFFEENFCFWIKLAEAQEEVY